MIYMTPDMLYGAFRVFVVLYVAAFGALVWEWYRS